MLLTKLSTALNVSCVVQSSEVHSCTVQYSLYQFHLETQNAVQCRSVQRGAVTVLYGTFQFNPGQCSVVQSGEVKLSLRQSSSVKCSAVHFSLLKCCPAQSSPVHSTDVWSSSFSGFCARLVQYCSFPSNSIHSLPAKYISIQLSPGPYKSIAVESSPVK